MAIDNKYGKISFDEENSIGEWEPVVVFRAADPLAFHVMSEYHRLCTEAGAPKRHTDLIINTAQKVLQWQNDHPSQVRELPTSSNWNGDYRLG